MDSSEDAGGNNSDITFFRKVFSSKFIAIVSGIFITIILLISFIYQNYPLGPAAKASKEFYLGYLVKASQSKCEKNKSRCFRLLDSTGKVIVFVNPDGIKIKKNDLMAKLGQPVGIKGVKIGQPPDIPSIVVTRIESTSDSEINRPAPIKKQSWV